MIVTLNPANEELLAEYPVMTAAEIDRILEASENAALIWKKIPVDERKIAMHRLADLLREQKEMHGAMISREMGKLYAESVAEVEKCAWVCEYYAEHAEAFLQPEKVDMDGGAGLVTFVPLGVVLGVMPWNFPFWQVIRF
ncbi:MAG: aldehyde dehydrogenase family protein, partial [Ignavibacteriaceae bacterium]|nr:aldehyde dehydrogenase family protein [Ignavibacteriaceae bacterium]